MATNGRWYWTMGNIRWSYDLPQDLNRTLHSGDIGLPAGIWQITRCSAGPEPYGLFVIRAAKGEPVGTAFTAHRTLP